MLSLICLASLPRQEVLMLSPFLYVNPSLARRYRRAVEGRRVTMADRMDGKGSATATFWAEGGRAARLVKATDVVGQTMARP